MKRLTPNLKTLGEALALRVLAERFFESGFHLLIPEHMGHGAYGAFCSVMPAPHFVLNDDLRVNALLLAAEVLESEA